MDQCGEGIETQHYLCTMQQKVSGKIYIDRTKAVAVFRALLTNVEVCSRLSFLSGVFLIWAGLLIPAHMETQPTLCISGLLVIPGGYENRLKELGLFCLKKRRLREDPDYHPVPKVLQEGWRGSSEQGHEVGEKGFK